ncbi:hypothetical protein QAD02_005214 [Eretmocerus hayati]|uniref:Uncharacterized protein n=1 Tax=Eretmocerus hayati TaxID=131215 RepID=A0ACC2NS84_9HYME|nr:hypothetical protein QAD02_005214 [Eretmocerus hayati]
MNFSSVSLLQFRELMRTKLLILNRFIPLDEAPPEIHEYPLFQLYQYCDSIMGKPSEKRKPKKVKIPRSLYRLMYPVEICKTPDSGDEDEDMTMKEITVDGVTRMVFMDKEEVEEMKKRKQVEEDVEHGYMFPQEEYEKLHYEADDVKELRDIQTISEMYTKANEIIGALYSLSKSDRKKRCEPEKDLADSSTASSSQATVAASSASKKSVV